MSFQQQAVPPVFGDFKLLAFCIQLMQSINEVVKSNVPISFELHMQLMRFMDVFKYNVLGDSRCTEFVKTILEENKDRDPFDEAFSMPDDEKLEEL